MRLEEKLAILAAAAKYDVSCASSGSRRKSSGAGLGSAAPSGVCHSYTEDGRCVSLLKVLLTNVCIYNCSYCINRRTNDPPRAAFTPQELVRLTLDFYRRNYIEGLFLSSGVAGSPDHTMELLIETAAQLRKQDFHGYIHLKCVPNASKELVEQAGRHADRLSINIELPSEASLKRLTEEKTYPSVLTPMTIIRDGIAQAREERKHLRRAPSFAPAGQSTQLIVGASPESDYEILRLSTGLYHQQALKRVYYSAFVPPDSAAQLASGACQPPLRREHRLYQADWLMRLYGFSFEDVIQPNQPFLNLDLDPKQVFAQRNPQLFPVDLNLADHAMLLRVPGLGLQSVKRIIQMRRYGRIRLEQLTQLGLVVSRALPFVRCDGMPQGQWNLGMNKTWPKIRSALTSQSDAETARAKRPSTPLIFVSDGAFDGLLSAIFASYAASRPPDAIEPKSQGQASLLVDRHIIENDPEKAARVWRGLEKHLGKKGQTLVLHAYLSEAPGIENAIYQFIRSRITGKRMHNPQAANTKLSLAQLAMRVRREAHRIKGFVRFSKTTTHEFVALIEPRYDVLPLVQGHFEQRFAGQRWIIFDAKRGYGLLHSGQETMQFTGEKDGMTLSLQATTQEEQCCQDLWRRYYQAATIAQRKNKRAQMSRLPRRFWPHLTEQQGG